jgi:hypothetical protein
LIAPKQGFANAIAQQGSLWRLLCVLERPGAEEALSDETDDVSQVDVVTKRRGWALLEALSSSPAVADKIVESSAWIELLGIMIGYNKFTKIWISRAGAAKALSRLLWDPRTGPVIGKFSARFTMAAIEILPNLLRHLLPAPLLERFLPASLVVVLKEEGPDTMLNLFDGESDTPELIWDAGMRTELRKVTTLQLDKCMQTRRETGKWNESLILEPSIRVKYSKLESELYLGGVYVSRFLKDPTYSIRDATTFLDMLLQRWTNELQMCTDAVVITEEKQSTEIIAGGQDTLQVVTDAIVYLCKVRTNLCEKLSTWGYMLKCLTFLDRILSLDMLGSPLLSVMRVLHVAVNCRANVESAIASGSNDRLHGIIAFTMRAIGDKSLHPDTGFMLEMLKRVFVEALGDVSCLIEEPPSGMIGTYTHKYGMAPSPAPGEGRVRVNMGDDPLGLCPTTATSNPAASTPPSGMLNSQSHTMNFGTTSSNHFSSSSYSAQQAYPYYQFPQQQQPFHDSYPIQQTVVGPGVGGSFNSHPTQGMVGSQGQLQRFSMHSQQASVQQQPYQPKTHLPQYPTPSANQSAIAYETVQEQHGGVHQVSTQLQNSASNTDNIHLPFPLSSGHSTISGYSDGGAKIIASSTEGLNQILTATPQDLQLPRNTTPWQHSSHPSQDPSNQYLPNTTVRNNIGVRTSQNVGFQDNHSQSSTSARMTQNDRGHVPFNQSYNTQQSQAQQLLMYPSTGCNTIQIASNQQPSHTLPHNQTMTRQEQQPAYQGPDQRSNAGPALKTVVDTVVQNPAQSATEGTGVDARTKPEPSIEAGHRAASTNGAPGSAKGRTALIESALHCDLATYLVETVLENSSLCNVKDPASVKVHAVELLKLLCQDPGYGMKFSLLLEKIPAWKKYVAQDHSLFITGHEQKTDYFLTDGCSSDSMKLLTKG